MNKTSRAISLDIARLDADVVDAFCAAHATEPVKPAFAQRVKHRLFGRITESKKTHLTVQATEDSWRAFGPGVQIKVLHESGGIMSYLLKLAPGASLAAHRHPHEEECVVLEGALCIGELILPAGGFHLARADSLHERITTLTGATIYLRGAVPSTEHCV